MYLPRIMIERFGWPGFIAFAVPNVVGCAAFGYVLRNRQHSAALVARHSMAMTWFSLITVAYHMFFVVFLFTEVMPVFGERVWLPVSAAAVVLALGAVLSFLPNRDWLVLSAAVYAVSLGVFFVLDVHGLATIPARGRDPRAELLWLAVPLTFGFLLCPYLDLTFHRAIQNSPSRHTFAVFGAAFAVMLVLTCVIWSSADPKNQPAIVIAHLLAQTIFTMGAHLREIRLSPVLTTSIDRGLAMVGPIAAAPLLFLGWWLPERWIVDGESIYLRFLVFYGLVFPAYCVIFHSGMRTAGKTAALVVLIVLGLPLYERGFFHHQPELTVIPVAAALLLGCLRRWRR